MSLIISNQGEGAFVSTNSTAFAGPDILSQTFYADLGLSTSIWTRAFFPVFFRGDTHSGRCALRQRGVNQLYHHRTSTTTRTNPVSARLQLGSMSFFEAFSQDVLQ